MIRKILEKLKLVRPVDYNSVEYLEAGACKSGKTCICTTPTLILGTVFGFHWKSCDLDRCDGFGPRCQYADPFGGE